MYLESKNTVIHRGFNTKFQSYLTHVLEYGGLFKSDSNWFHLNFGIGQKKVKSLFLLFIINDFLIITLYTLSTGYLGYKPRCYEVLWSYYPPFFYINDSSSILVSIHYIIFRSCMEISVNPFIITTTI